MAVVSGIHHVSALAGDPEENFRFYTRVLGLHLVKRTVNFDDPSQYHFYYGTGNGAPGTLLTFFVWSADGRPGRRGTGQVDGITLSIPTGSRDFWVEHLSRSGIEFAGPAGRFNEEVISFSDPDGLLIELVCNDDPRPGVATRNISAAHAIRGIYALTLSVKDEKRSLEFAQTHLGFREKARHDGRVRCRTGEGSATILVDFLVEPQRLSGSVGLGTVHHVAWRVGDNRLQIDLRKQLMRAGARVTPVLDRYYFNSVYFREPNQIFYEIATDAPGFLIDETADTLGGSLQLPPWLEKERADIEARLQPLNF